MKGEVSAMKRPQNSLLEEVVEFDLTTRPGELDVPTVDQGLFLLSSLFS